MKFLKKNIFFLLLTAFFVSILLFPKFGDAIRSKILMKPSLDKIESEVTITPEDYNVKLRGVNVPDAQFSDFKGKTVFLNFWGSWCPPCRAEYPSIQKLYETKNDKLVFVLIAMQDKEEDVKKFLEQNKYSTPVYFAESPISEKLLPKVFPTTFIISKEGRILKKETGASDWNSAAVHQFIDTITQ